jgi:hypothetical protein
VYAIAANFADKTKVSTAERSESAIFANQPIAAMVAVVDSVPAPTPPLPPMPASGLTSFNSTASLNLVVPFAVLQATGAGGSVALPPEGSLVFNEAAPSIKLSIPFVSFL